MLREKVTVLESPCSLKGERTLTLGWLGFLSLLK
jgi:hypothetical protein